MMFKQLILSTCSLTSMMASFTAEARFTVSQSGENFVVKDNEGCLAIFDSQGKERSSTNACSSRNLRDAEEAVDDYRDGRHNNKDGYSDDRHSRSSHHSHRHIPTEWPTA